MRTLLVVLVVSLAGCEDETHSTYFDAGVSFKHIGDPCQPDVPPSSECGYPPQFYCANGVCASACNSDADCPFGTCVGAGNMVAGECRLPAGDDGGT